MRNDQPRALESLVFYQGTGIDHQRVIDEIRGTTWSPQVMEEGRGRKGRADIIVLTKEMFRRSHLRNGIILGLVALHVIDRCLVGRAVHLSWV